MTTKVMKNCIQNVCDKYGIQVYELKVRVVDDFMGGGKVSIVELNGVGQRRIFSPYYTKIQTYKEAFRIVQVYTSYIYERMH